MNRKDYTNEFKLEAVRLAERRDVAVSQVARELGVHATVLRRWMLKFGAKSDGSRVTPDEHDELMRLRRELRRVTEERDNLKKSGRYLHEGTAVRYRFVKDNLSQFRVTTMCRVLRVSTSGFYAWQGRGESERSVASRALVKRILEVYKKSGSTYGSRRVHRELIRQGVQCSRSRIAHLMKINSVSAKPRRRFVVTTDSNHALPVAPNLLDRQFICAGPNRVWASDITYIRTAEGWLYLAVVIDLHSRMAVGWSMSDRLASPLVVDALSMAISRRDPDAGLIHHSDRGSQYAGADYQRMLGEAGMVCSMSRRADCYDNAPVESFFGSLKTERVHTQRYQTREEARRDIFEYIELFYNTSRLHSSLGYLSPAQFEAAAHPA
ncbi:MAG: IS3 family transposase [Dehalococcoidia bacterium]